MLTVARVGRAGAWGFITSALGEAHTELDGVMAAEKQLLSPCFKVQTFNRAGHCVLNEIIINVLFSNNVALCTAL